MLTFSPLPSQMPRALTGAMCQSPNTCQEVKYSFWMNVSIERISEAIATATVALPPEPPDEVPSETEVSVLPRGHGVAVFALSGGAIAVADWIEHHAGDVDAPSAEALSFVVIGNPTRKYGGVNRAISNMPPSQYQVIDIARQYDPVADAPDRFNLLAQLNVMMGLLSPLHTNYAPVNVDDPANIRWTEGHITYILVPTLDLPLLAPLRALGLRDLAARLDAPLREIIERAYDRPFETTPPSTPEPQSVPIVQSIASPAIQPDALGATDGTDDHVAVSGGPAPDAPIGESTAASETTRSAENPSQGDAIEDEEVVEQEVVDDKVVADEMVDDESADDSVDENLADESDDGDTSPAHSVDPNEVTDAEPASGADGTPAQDGDSPAAASS